MRRCELLSMVLRDGLDRVRDVVLRRFGGPVVLSSRAVTIGIAATVAVSVVGGTLLVIGLGSDSPERPDQPGRQARGAAKTGPVADTNDPDTAGYAGEVIATALKLGDAERQEYLRLHTASDTELGAVDDVLGQWQSRLLEGYSAARVADLDLWIVTVGHRTLTREKSGSTEISRLILAQDFRGKPAGRGDSGAIDARVLVSVTVSDGPDGLRLDTIDGFGPMRSTAAPLSGVFHPLEGSS
ncbi:MAG: hypothetical protein ACRCYQ_05985 [Nocardioides sp.]